MEGCLLSQGLMLHSYAKEKRILGDSLNGFEDVGTDRVISLATQQHSSLREGEREGRERG